MKEIELKHGKYIMVDDEDYPLLSRFNWRYNHVDKAEVVVTEITGSNGKRFAILFHQMIMPTTAAHYIHHRDGNVLNNQKNNLVIISTNMRRHLAKKHKIGDSSYRGVTRKRWQYGNISNKWESKITKDKKIYYLGLFNNEKDAALAYNKKARELYGELAYQNNVCDKE